MLDKIHNLPTIIDIILIPDFSLMAFSSAIEPLRLANRLADRKLYDWRVVSVMETLLFPAMVWRLFHLAV